MAVVIPVKKNKVLLELEERLQESNLSLVRPYITLKEYSFISKKTVKKLKYLIESILRNKKPIEITINKLNYHKNKGLFLEVEQNKELKKLRNDLIEALDEDKSFPWWKKIKFTPHITVVKPSYRPEEAGDENKGEIIKKIEEFNKEFKLKQKANYLFKQEVNYFVFLKKKGSKQEDFIYEHAYYLDKIAEGTKKDLFEIAHEGFKILFSLPLKIITIGKVKSFARDSMERMEKQIILITNTALEIKSLDETLDKKVVDEYVKADDLYEFCIRQQNEERKKGKTFLYYAPTVAYIIDGIKKMFKEKVKLSFESFGIEGEDYHKVLKKIYPTAEDVKKDLSKLTNLFKEMYSVLERNKFNTNKIFGLYPYLKGIKLGYERTKKVWGEFIDNVYRKNWEEIIDNLDYKRGKKWWKKLIKEIDNPNWSEFLKLLIKTSV